VYPTNLVQWHYTKRLVPCNQVTEPVAGRKGFNIGLAKELSGMASRETIVAISQRIFSAELSKAYQKAVMWRKPKRNPPSYSSQRPASTHQTFQSNHRKSCSAPIDIVNDALRDADHPSIISPHVPTITVSRSLKNGSHVD